MSDEDNLLRERENTHGDWEKQGAHAQRIKAAFKDGGHWDALHPLQREALELIATKISRILNGNPSHADHWLDLAGYADLVAGEIRRAA